MRIAWRRKTTEAVEIGGVPRAGRGLRVDQVVDRYRCCTGMEIVLQDTRQRIASVCSDGGNVERMLQAVIGCESRHGVGPGTDRRPAGAGAMSALRPIGDPADPRISL
jgi:hypothetical protein